MTTYHNIYAYQMLQLEQAKLRKEERQRETPAIVQAKPLGVRPGYCTHNPTLTAEYSRGSW
jgi:hypothetical protein